MSDRFPYDMPSRDALIRLASETEDKTFDPRLVTFEDFFFSPTPLEPGRTFIEMIDLEADHKFWYVYRRLNINRPVAEGSIIRLDKIPTPGNIAREINRSRNMKLDASDISFSDTPISYTTSPFEYTLKAMTGSYAYYGETKIIIELTKLVGNFRYLENGGLRFLEDGTPRELEH